MPTSSSRLAYEDCFEILDMAIDDDAGARIKVADKRDAISLRVRLHTARRIDREQNMLTYQEDHPLHGKSAYDRLVIRIKELEEAYYLYLEKITRNVNVEPLSEVAQLEAPRPMKLINPPREVPVQRLTWRRV